MAEQDPELDQQSEWAPCSPVPEWGCCPPLRRTLPKVLYKLKDGQLHVRVFVGSEINGQTEVFTRVAYVPPGCAGHQPESTTARGVGR